MPTTVTNGSWQDVRVSLGPDAHVTGKLVLPGFVETHIHPDKAFIADRTQGLRAGGPTL